MWRLSVGGSEKLEEKRSFSLNPKSSLKCHLVVSGSGKIVFHLTCSGCIACMCDNALSHPTSVGHGFLDPPFRPWLDTSCSHQRKIFCDTELSHREDFGVLCTSRTFHLFLCTSNPTPNIHTSQLLDGRVKVPRHCLSVRFNTLFKGTVPYMAVSSVSPVKDTWSTHVKMYSTSLQGHLVLMHNDLSLCVNQGYMILSPLLHHFKEM